MEDFNSLNLPEGLMHTLQHMEFVTPTPIQALAIPFALEGRDILGTAQTGTGKTAAFGIPMAAKIMNGQIYSALVLTPTRELATQVMGHLKKLLGAKWSKKSALLIGGESMSRQLQQLKNNPVLIVGTPGRVNDHLERRSLNLSTTSYLVLDETDRMLDMGFSVQIEQIVKHLTSERQTLLFSATLPSKITQLAHKYLNNPERISVGSVTAIAKNINQEIIKLAEVDKYDQLLTQLDKREGSVLIFMKTKYSTERMSQKLNKLGLTSSAIHGDLPQNKRNRVIGDFRDKKYKVLVATDVAARGLDIPHIEHVINYDIPHCPEDYIHRIGRTARAGSSGSALCFITPSDHRKWMAIDKMLNPDSHSTEFDFANEGRQKSGRFKGKFGSRSGSRSGSSSNSGSSSFNKNKKYRARSHSNRNSAYQNSGNTSKS